MKGRKKSFGTFWRAAAVAALAGAMAILHAQGFSFLTLAPGYSQHLFGVTSSFSSSNGYLGGVVVLQNGDVISAECRTSSTRLHRFSASTTYTDPATGTVLHPETITSISAGGCGIALHPDGFLYSNMNDGTFGVAKINLTTGAVVKMGPVGNALGIAVDPVTNHLLYAGASCKPGFVSPMPPTCTLIELDPATALVVGTVVLNASQVGYVDGLTFDPTGTYIFLTNRYPSFSLVVINRATGLVVQQISMASEPVGIAFHAASPKFVITNNQDGTLTRFDFPNDNYTAVPNQSVFASGGFRGDLMQVGPDGCVYLTQNGARYDSGDTDKKNSIVQICSGFAPPPGVTPIPPPVPSSLCGSVYNDANNNGVFETTESGIAGVTVTLTGADNFGVPVSMSTTTDVNGGYCFNNLSPGTYTITETQPSGYLSGKNTLGAPGGTVGNDSFSNIVLPAGYNGMNYNFGELLPSSLCGYVYLDANNNGVKNASEAGIAGVTITLTGADDLSNPVNMSMATGTDGAYCFTGLRPGTYTITETQPAGFVDGKDTQGTPGTGTTGNDVFSNIVLNQNVNGQNNNFGEMIAVAGVSLVKRTNGSDNNSAPGLYVATGAAITWTYFVRNIGNVALSNIVVTDDKIGAITCPATTLAVAANMTCTATGTAAAGQYTNLGAVTATDDFGHTPTASNPDNYFGVSSAISIVKKTNGTDNDVPPGLLVPAGSTLTFTYVVTNTGNATLSEISVRDDKLGTINCPSQTLAAGSSMTCTRTGAALAGQQTNTGTVTAQDPLDRTLTASNPENYFGTNPAISLVKKTNGADNDSAPGLIVPTGTAVTWTYIVTNTGNMSLSAVAVTDNKIGAISCPSTTLAVGASMTCSATGAAIAGQYTNIGSATGADVTGKVVTGSNPENVFGASPGVSLVKTTNGIDNDTGTGPLVPVGSTVTWRYLVTNTGNITLSTIAVTDDKAGAISCPATTLAAGAAMTCTKTGAAVAGQYTNLGTVTAKDRTGAVVTASNRDNYFGAITSISLVKKTNGTDNDTAPGQLVPAGSAITWTYMVTNTGNVAVSSVAVTDNKIGAITCPATTLAAGASFTCTATGTAIAGQYTNIGAVTAQDPTGKVITASNPDNYFGASPAISLVKMTNGADNDMGPGPTVGIGSTVTWTYIVTNTGNVALSSVVVSDDKAGPVGCPATTLGVGATMTCTKVGTAVAGLYTNIGTVTAADPTGKVITASNPDHYFGARTAIALVKKTNGTDNDTGAGPRVIVGSAVTWTYTVSNTGNTTLSNVTVTDDKAGPVGCPATTLIAGATMTCTKRGTAVAGQYTNVGTVTAIDDTGKTVTAQNLDHYYGLIPPTAVDDQATTLEGTPVTINVLANDILGNGGAVTVTAVGNPAHGTAVAGAGGVITYTPGANFFGADSFRYTISDSLGGSSSATVTVQVSRLARFVAFSSDYTFLGDDSVVHTGDVGANTPRVHKHDHGRINDYDKDDLTVWFDEGATMQQATSRVVGDTVQLDKWSSIYNLVYNGLVRKSRGTILGTTIHPMATPFLTMPTFPIVTPGTQDVIVKGGTRTLAAGSYGRVQVRNRGTLILTGGLYQMITLDLEEEATVILRGASELRIKADLDGDYGVRLIVDSSVAGLKASQVVVYVQGADHDCRHDFWGSYAPTIVEFGDESVIQANIYAPQGTIRFGWSVKGAGAFLGQHVIIGDENELTLDSAFK